MPGPTAGEAEANAVLPPAPPEPRAATRLRADLFSTQPPPPARLSSWQPRTDAGPPERRTQADTPQGQPRVSTAAASSALPRQHPRAAPAFQDQNLRDPPPSLYPRSRHPSSSHEVAHSGLVQERSTGIPPASALGGPLYPPASRPGATVPQQTPLLPPPHPAGGRARGPRPHFPLRPSLQARSDPPAHRRPRSPLASGGRPSPGPGRGGRPQGGSPLRPQPRPRIPEGARPSGGAEPAHSPDLFPPRLPAGAPAVPPRRVTAAAPPPSWARQALPTPAGSGQPRPRHSRTGPCLPSPRGR
ncbi:hypothetical protein ACRRTK_011290 [Alexandromys fortis]